MLTACAASPSEPANLLPPDPVIETRTVIERVCPAELRLALPARPVLPASARLDGNEAGLGWLAEMLARTGLIEDRIADAAKECP